MAARDYEVAPLTQGLSLDKVVQGLVQDLDDLRAGKIGVNDAVARSLLAKQIFNGVRLYMNGTKMLSSNAREISPAPVGAGRSS